MILPNPTQKEVIAVCLDNSHTCQIYSQSTSTIVATLDHVKSASWLPEGDKIICGCEDGSLTIYDKEGLQQETFPLDDSVKSVFEEYGVDKSDDIYGLFVIVCKIPQFN
jgi:WD40 repeat protein